MNTLTLCGSRESDNPMKLPTNSKKPYTVRDDDDIHAIQRAYAFYWRTNPLWLANMPGVDNKAIRADYRARIAPPLSMVSTPMQNRGLAA